jgi:hypothetical protein
MSDILIRPFPTDPHWTYDDPSGVPDLPLEVPESLRGGVEQAAARDGVTPVEWLRRLVSAGLALKTPTAV